MKNEERLKTYYFTLSMQVELLHKDETGQPGESFQQYQFWHEYYHGLAL